MNIVLRLDTIPDSLITCLADREASVWVQGAAAIASERDDIERLIRLPWKQVFLEETDRGLVAALEQADDGPLVRQRGFLHVVDSDPSRINLPPRSLPVYLLAGRDNRGSTFERQLRRMTMLEELRRSGIRQLVVIAANGVPPAGVEELWTTGFRTRLVVVDDVEDAASRLERWLDSYGEGPTAAVVALPLAVFAARLVEAFHAARGDDRLTVRQRDQAGSVRLVDLSDADDRDRPILDSYDLILDRDLSASELLVRQSRGHH